jgi:Domain of unknown function (DUF3387)
MASAESYSQALQAALNKRSGASGESPEQINAAICQLVSSAITTDGEVIDVFTAAGLAKPDISIRETWCRARCSAKSSRKRSTVITTALSPRCK